MCCHLLLSITSLMEIPWHGFFGSCQHWRIGGSSESDEKWRFNGDSRNQKEWTWWDSSLEGFQERHPALQRSQLECAQKWAVHISMATIMQLRIYLKSALKSLQMVMKVAIDRRKNTCATHVMWVLQQLLGDDSPKPTTKRLMCENPVVIPGVSLLQLDQQQLLIQVVHHQKNLFVP